MIPYGQNHTCPDGEPWGECCAMPYGMFLRSQLVDTAGLDNLPDPEPLIGEDILFRNSLTWLIGKPGHGKSFVALDMAGCVATGETWQGYATNGGTVLYVVAEGVTGTKKRVRAWEQAYGHPMTGVHFLPVAVLVKNGGNWSALVDLAAELQPALVIIDTQARVTLGIDENSNSEMGEFVAAAERLKKATRACVVLVHHVGKADNGGRGATAVEGAVDAVLKCTRDGDALTLSCAKNKDGEEWADLTLRMVKTGQSVTLALNNGERKPADIVARTGAALRKWRELFSDEWVSGSALIKAEVFAERTFFNVRLALVDAGVVERIGEGRSVRYRLSIHD